jgi:hypothetical protein
MARIYLFAWGAALTLLLAAPVGVWAQNEPSPSDHGAPQQAQVFVQPASNLSPTSPVDATTRNLRSIIEQAAAQLDATRLPRLDSSLEQLRRSLAALENYIRIDSPQGQAWSRFLRLEELHEQLSKAQPDLGALVDLEMNMRQNYLGLEYPQFVTVRDDLNRVVRALKYGLSPELTIDKLEARLNALLTELDTPSSGADSQRRTALGLITNYLHESEQVPAAVANIRSLYGSPNIQITATENLLNRILSRAVVEPSPVNECILGTRVVGQACLQGGVTADLLPMLGGVSLSLNMSANLSTNNRGYNRGVVLRTTGTSPVFASKQLVITPNGVSSSPAQVTTQLQTQINSIEHRLRIVRRIAQKKAAEQKPQADAIARSRLQNRVQSQYDSQVSQQVAQANVQFASAQSNPRPEFVRLGVPRPQWSVSSTSQSIHGSVVQAATYQLAAPKPTPLPTPANADIVVDAHQSVIENALDIAVGGRTIRSEHMAAYAKQITGHVPEQIREEARGEPWSITMATFHPVEVEFDDQLIKVTLRISQMTRGENTLADPAIISATYFPTVVGDTLVLTRQGDVEIAFARTSRGVRAVTLRSFLKGKFDTVFKEQITTEPIDIAKSFPRAPHMSVRSIQTDDGWLQVGVN